MSRLGVWPGSNVWWIRAISSHVYLLTSQRLYPIIVSLCVPSPDLWLLRVPHSTPLSAPASLWVNLCLCSIKAFWDLEQMESHKSQEPPPGGQRDQCSFLVLKITNLCKPHLSLWRKMGTIIPNWECMQSSPNLHIIGKKTKPWSITISLQMSLNPHLPHSATSPILGHPLIIFRLLPALFVFGYSVLHTNYRNIFV